MRRLALAPGIATVLRGAIFPALALLLFLVLLAQFGHAVMAFGEQVPHAERFVATEPKHCYLVVPIEAQAERTIKKQIEQLVQLNEGTPSPTIGTRSSRCSTMPLLNRAREPNEQVRGRIR